MSRTWWIVVVLVAVGVGLAVLVGVLGTRNEPSTSEAVSSLCGSLTSLETSIQNLASIDPSTVTQSELQSDLDAIQSNWNQVKSDAQDVQGASTGQLADAWNGFKSAVADVPNAASISDAVNSVSQAAQQLVSTAQSTVSSLNCP